MREILLSDDVHRALVDDELYEVLIRKKWHFIQMYNQPIGYAQCWNPYPNAITMHRLIMDPPPGMVVHHKDFNTLNNQRGNLTVVTNSVNQHFRLKQSKGYHWESSRSKWKAMIMVDGRALFLGRFDSEQMASAAYQAAKETLFGNGDV